MGVSRHVDRRQRLRGAEVTRGTNVTWTRIISLFNKYIGLPAYRKTIITSSKSRTLYTCFIPLIYSVWD